jgi:hypothetical protein
MVNKNGISSSSKFWLCLVITCTGLTFAWSAPSHANTWSIEKATAVVLNQHDPQNPTLIMLQNRQRVKMLGRVAGRRRSVQVNEGQIVGFDSKGNRSTVVPFTEVLAGLADVTVIDRDKLLVVATQRVVQMSRNGSNRRVILSAHTPTLLSTGEQIQINPTAVAAPNYVRGTVNGVEGVWALATNRFGKWVATAQRFDVSVIAGLFRHPLQFGHGLFEVMNDVATYTGPNDLLEAFLTRRVSRIEQLHRLGDRKGAKGLFKHLKKLSTNSDFRTPFWPTLPALEARWRVHIAIADLKYRLGPDFKNLQGSCSCSCVSGA